MTTVKRPRVTLDPTERDRAMTLLTQEVEATSVAAVARRLGSYGRVTVSMVASGSYAGRPDAVLGRVLEVFGADAVACPHLNRDLPRAECRANAARQMSTSSPAAYRFWEACQSCPQKGAHDD